jgi:serine/threonine protein kinase
MGENTKKFSADIRVPLEAEGFEISKGLGKGAFGEVFLATKKGESFAVKAIDKQQVKKRPFL